MGGNDLLSLLNRDYLRHSFSSEVLGTDPAILDKIMLWFTLDMNNCMLAPFWVDDVKNDVFSIGDLKVHGADVLHAIFSRGFVISQGGRSPMKFL